MPVGTGQGRRRRRAAGRGGTDFVERPSHNLRALARSLRSAKLEAPRSLSRPDRHGTMGRPKRQFHPHRACGVVGHALRRTQEKGRCLAPPFSAARATRRRVRRAWHWQGATASRHGRAAARKSTQDPCRAIRPARAEDRADRAAMRRGGQSPSRGRRRRRSETDCPTCCRGRYRRLPLAYRHDACSTLLHIIASIAAVVCQSRPLRLRGGSSPARRSGAFKDCHTVAPLSGAELHKPERSEGAEASGLERDARAGIPHPREAAVEHANHSSDGSDEA